MSAVLHRNLRQPPAMALQGDGCYLVDDRGRRYLDASGGAAVSCLGHSHPRVVQAVQRQAATLSYAHTGFFTNEPSERLAERLIADAPQGFGAGRVAFVGSGSEAMEAALKLVRQYFIERGESERTHLIARRMSYHGNTLGALSVSGHMQRRAAYEPMLMRNVSHIAPCFAYRHRRADESEAEYGRRAADELDAEIRRIGPGRVAAFIAEPVVGATLGCVTSAPGYFQRIRDICDHHGVLFVADEVMCGMGRTGSLFASEQEDVCPDIITCAKGLGAGYQPIAAVLASSRVVDAIANGSGQLAHGHTYMSHALACAAALAVMDVIADEDLLAGVVRKGEKLAAGLRQRFGQHANVGDIRGRGLFYALEFVADRESKQPFPRASRMAETLKDAAMEVGLICYPSSGAADGVAGDHVIIAPPYIIDEAEIAELIDKLEAALAATLQRTRLSS